MFRDTNRMVCLNALGRTSLQQVDLSAARAAYGQSIALTFKVVNAPWGCESVHARMQDLVRHPTRW